MRLTELRLEFIKCLNETYGVNENLGRFLFERWHIKHKCTLDNLSKFIKSEKVRRVFFVRPDINRAKRYSRRELIKIGIKLGTLIDAKERIYKDSKYGFTWKEKYHGMADEYSGLFELIEPEPDDAHLMQLD